MDKTYLVSVEDCCMHYNVEVQFIELLELHGLLQPTQLEDRKYIEQDNLQQLEKYISMHYDLDINMEGIEVITRLLERIEAMQEEMKRLKMKRSL